MPTCPVCGSEYTVTEYQARAADEPPRVITFCPQCPLDHRRLGLRRGRPRRGDDTPVSRYEQELKPVPPVQTGSSKQVIVVRLDDGTSDSFNALTTVRSSTEHHGFIQVLGVAEFVRLRMGVSYMTPGVEWQVETSRVSVVVGPGMRMVTHTMSTPVLSRSAKRMLKEERATGVSEVEVRMLSPGMHITRVSEDGGKPFMVVHINTTQAAYEVVSLIMTAGLVKTDLRSYIPRALVMGIESVMSRGYDTVESISEYSMYTSKTDGERMLMVRIGVVWVLVRRLAGWRVMMWKESLYHPPSHDIGPVYDVECACASTELVLIDVLVDNTSFVRPFNATLAYVLDLYSKLPDGCRVLSVREYFNNKPDAERYAMDSGLPNDGVVEFVGGSMDVAKHKPVRAVELAVAEDGHSLITSDGRHYASVEEHMDVGAVVEVRMRGERGVVKIVEAMMRYDKEKANDSDAVRNVFETMISTSSSTVSYTRREVLSFSSSCRNFIVTSASAHAGGGYIIDVGTGDGRSVYVYDAVTVPVVMIEPDGDRVKELVRVVKGKRGSASVFTADNPEIGVSMLGKIVTRVASVLIIHTSASSLLSDHFQSFMKKHKPVIVSSFSATHCFKELRELSTRGFRVYGCTYLYDDVNEDGEIVSMPGLRMRVTDKVSKVATVEWGRDKAYTEHALTAGEMGYTFTWMKAIDVVEDGRVASQHATAVISHINVFISR